MIHISMLVLVMLSSVYRQPLVGVLVPLHEDGTSMAKLCYHSS